MWISKKDYEELEQKLIEKERARIDKLISDVEEKFNIYMQEYFNANDIIKSQCGTPAFRFYTENEMVKPIEYGEIFIPALHIKFIKGEKADE